jgi:transcriptional regulator with XRE-family HTH domain
VTLADEAVLNLEAPDVPQMKKTPDSVDRHVGARLRMQRLFRGMSQEKLGVTLGVTFQQIQKYEKGVNRIGASRLQQLARALEVSPAFFFEGVAASDAALSDATRLRDGSDYLDFLATAEGLQLNRAFSLIRDPKVRKRILDLITSLAQEPNGDQPARNGYDGPMS